PASRPSRTLRFLFQGMVWLMANTGKRILMLAKRAEWDELSLQDGLGARKNSLRRHRRDPFRSRPFDHGTIGVEKQPEKSPSEVNGNENVEDQVPLGQVAEKPGNQIRLACPLQNHRNRKPARAVGRSAEPANAGGGKGKSLEVLNVGKQESQ